MKKFLRLLRFFDARDAFVFAGFVLLFVGLAAHFGLDVAMIVTGGIVLVKGLTHWV